QHGHAVQEAVGRQRSQLHPDEVGDLGGPAQLHLIGTDQIGGGDHGDVGGQRGCSRGEGANRTVGGPVPVLHPIGRLALLAPARRVLGAVGCAGRGGRVHRGTATFLVVDDRLAESVAFGGAQERRLGRYRLCRGGARSDRD